MSTGNLNIEEVLHGENMAVWAPDDETSNKMVRKTIFAVVSILCALGIVIGYIS